MNIFFEDNHLIAVAKPSGVLTHGDETGDQSMLDQVKEYIKKKYKKPGNVFLQPVHRLDRPTSGLLLFARTSKATTRMTNAFKEKKIEKIYYALVGNPPKQRNATLTNYLLKDRKNNVVKVATASTENAKKCVLDYELKRQIKKESLLKVMPKTGRSHQIRVQLSNIGCPIIGDLKYGSKIKTDGRSIALHAYQLTFIHPIKKEQVIITCPFPNNHIWKNFQ